jgi:hypothetical protein
VSLDDDSLATSQYLVACQMFIPPSKTYFRRSITLQRKIMSMAASGLRPDRVRAPRGLNGVGALRQRLEAANRRVAESRQLVAGWRDIIERERAAGHDVSVARDLLETFQTRLEVAMAEKEQAAKALAQRFRDLFEGIKGRPPTDDQELQEWLASPDGQAATAFEPTSFSPWGERGRS